MLSLGGIALFIIGLSAPHMPWRAGEVPSQHGPHQVYTVRLFNCDDACRLLVDGHPIFTVGPGSDIGPVDITQHVATAPARPSRLTVQNLNKEGSFAYGFELWGDGRLLDRAECGRAFRVNCDGKRAFKAGYAAAWEGLAYRAPAKVAAAPSPRDEPPPLPHVNLAAHPFEGAQYGPWRVRQPTLVYADRNTSSPALATIETGEVFQAETGEVHVQRPEEVVAERSMRLLVAVPSNPHDGRLDAWWQGPKTALLLERGDRLYQVGTFGEGAARYWFRGRYYDINFYDIGQQGNPPRVEKAPESHWWVRVRTRAGVLGWVVDPSAEGMGAFSGDPPVPPMSESTVGRFPCGSAPWRPCNP